MIALTLLFLTMSVASPLKTASAGAAPSAFVLTSRTPGTRLRALGKAGDFGLRNQSVTAVVRKKNGWLIDFWRNTPTLPTAPQLKKLTHIDGLWVLEPVLVDGSREHSVIADQVMLDEASVVARSLLKLGSGTLEFSRRYTLSERRPALIIETQLRHVDGGRISHIAFEERLKWGNVDYFTDSQGRISKSFRGRAHWVGRKGAGGDLKLIAIEPSAMDVEWTLINPGLAPAIKLKHGIVSLDPGKSATFRQELSYDPITIAAKPAMQAPTGLLRVQIVDERGRALPSKLSLRGHGKTPTPDFGNDGDETGAGRFIWSGTGRFSKRLPAGNYELMATAGFERDAQSWSVKLEPEKTLSLEGVLPRVIQTPGWVSADLHLHQAASVDADVAFSTRLISVAAEGVEVAVATDHYAVTDFAPAMARLLSRGELSTPLITITGSEVSTVGHRFGHFNVFPMPPHGHVHYENTTPHELFEDARRAAPNGLLQVNHPRWPGIGYFHRYRLDPKQHRVPAKYRDEYDPNFDAIEVFNGLEAWSEHRLRLVLHDWLGLLGRGHRYTATGNSDSHKLFFADPGVPRNFVHYGDAEQDEQDRLASVGSIIQAIRDGHVVVSSGPILDVDIDGVGPGGSVDGGQKTVPLHVRVRAAPWIDVRELEVLLGPKANRIRHLPIPASKNVLRFEKTFAIPGTQKTFVVVLVKGHENLPNVHADGIRPVAFTNPIWIEP